MSQSRTTRLRWFPGDVALDVPRGEPLMNAVDNHPALQLPMACRAANCGTCRVRVLAGASGVIPADPWEQDVLRIHEAAPDERLGCQLCFKNDTDCPEVVLERVT